MTNRSLAQEVIDLASKKDVFLATAESLTGGLLADALVSIPGASKVFRGGVVAYSILLKEKLLGVDHQLLAEYGAVHKEVAKQMAHGASTRCFAQLGIATTGVAGPDPDPHTGAAAGTVWIGVSGDSFNEVEKLSLTGGRQEIREAAVKASLELTIKALKAFEL